MTEEQTKAVQEIQQKPDYVPYKQELDRIRQLFQGWTNDKAPVTESTAYQIWSYLQRGFQPTDLLIMGSSVYPKADGILNHARKVAKREGRRFGHVTYSDVTSEEERKIAGLKPGEHDHVLCLKAVYQEREPVVTEYPDGRKETRWEWVDLDTDYGKASMDPKKGSYYKMQRRDGEKDQPIELKFPSEMARARGARRVLKRQFGLDLPEEDEGFSVPQVEAASVEAIEPPDDLPYGQPEGDAVEDAEPETVEAQELPWEQEETQ